MSDMAKFTNISVTTVMRLFDKVVVENNFKELPEVICIDEFKGDSVEQSITVSLLILRMVKF